MTPKQLQNKEDRLQWKEENRDKFKTIMLVRNVKHLIRKQLMKLENENPNESLIDKSNANLVT